MKVKGADQTKLDSMKLLNALNKAYAIPESEEEKTLRARAKRYFVREILKRSDRSRPSNLR
jgi:hypothetical protein